MNNFFIIANSQKDKNFEYTKKLCEYIRSRGCTCDYQLPLAGEENSLNYARKDSVPKETQCVIVLGGDGTLIQAARELSDINIPVCGINIGTLGYLMEINKEQAENSIDRLISDEYFEEKRMLLSGTVIRDGREIFSGCALNDIVLNRVGPLNIIEFDVYVNDEFLINYPADGIVIATPTGSTAYNMSAGGPIIRPMIETIVMTPICAHVLNKSSVIFGGEDVLEIRMCNQRSHMEERAVTFDGASSINLISGDRIIIKKADRYARLIRMQKQNFLQILRNKLS